MPKSSDLEASRRALCRSVKNFLDKAGNINYLQWMDDHAYLRTMIQEGKDGLEWYRCKSPKIFHPQSSVHNPQSTIIDAAQDGGPGKDADCGGHDQGARPSGEDASHNQNDP